MTSSVTCLGCGVDRHVAPWDQPCPNCGSTGLEISIAAPGGFSVVSKGSAQRVSVGYYQVPQWHRQWQTVQFQLRKFRDASAPGGSIDPQVISEAADALLLHLWHLADWLVGDDDLTSLDWAAIRDFARSRPALALVEGYTQTRKHAKRRDPEDVEARPIRFSLAPTGSSLTIGSRRAGSPQQPWQEHDALQVAEAAEQDWRDLLTQHGVPIPD